MPVTKAIFCVVFLLSITERRIVHNKTRHCSTLKKTRQCAFIYKQVQRSWGSGHGRLFLSLASTLFKGHDLQAYANDNIPKSITSGINSWTQNKNNYTSSNTLPYTNSFFLLFFKIIFQVTFMKVTTTNSQMQWHINIIIIIIHLLDYNSI